MPYGCCVSLTYPLKSIDKATRILGPAPEHVVDWMMVPLSEEKTFGRELVRSAPGMTVYSRAVLD